MAKLITIDPDKFRPKTLQLAEKEGIRIEKGAILTPEYILKNKEWIEKYMSFFSAYPDLFLDLIKPSDSQFTLFFYQRIVLRALMRFKEIYICAPRAFSKSFLSIMGMFLQCVFIPGHKCFICAPKKNQSAQIAKEKILEIYDKFPLLMNEIEDNRASHTPGNFGKDAVTLRFKNGSVFDVVSALDSQRGGRRNSGIIDEIAMHDETPINEVVLPLLNVSRRMPNGQINSKEPNQQTVCITSAGSKVSFAYYMLITAFENAIMRPQSSFVLGCDYRVPVMHNLISKDFVNKLRLSPTFNEQSFASEYCSIWRGASKDSWFNLDRMLKYRVIKNPEKHQSNRGGLKQFYILSVDVGRLHDQSPVCVLRVNIREEKFYVTLVNIFVLGKTEETKPFPIQVRDLKEIIEKYNPREVVIDTNGIGVNFGDEMMRTHVASDGHELPAYGFINDDNYMKIQPKNCIKILYGIKANGPLNSKIHSNCYSKINSGTCRFLIDEKDAKSMLLSTKVGSKMTPVERVERLMPHELTTHLFTEMANLKLKQTGIGTDIALERINPRYPKDKYSAFSYGLWRIKELEEEHFKKQKRKGLGRQLVFFTEGD